VAKCTYCDHAGLGVFVNVHVSLRRAGGALCLVHMSRQLSDAFTLLRLDEVLPVAPDEAAALRLIQSSGR
jgi:anti-anti-sigma factor